MIHQPWGGVQGAAEDISRHAQEILKMRDRINQILADHTGQTLEKVQKRGVKVRIIAPHSKDHKKIAGTLKGVAEVKAIKDVKARFCTVDGKDFMFMALDDQEVHPTYDLGVWVKTPYFATAMDCMFDTLWNQG